MTCSRWIVRALAFACVLATVGAANAANLAINFGADEPNGAGSSVDGPAGIYGTGVWNNTSGANGSASNLVDGDGVATLASVEWASPNTWSSTGRGEENNTAPAGENRDLMTGYLDTTDALTPTATVNVSGLSGLYDRYNVVVYIKGGVNGRGGDYTIGDQTLSHIDTAAFSGDFVEGSEGDYLVFSNLSGDAFTLTSTGVNFRAPINGIEVTPIPEPASCVLALLGVGTLVLIRRRK